MADSKTLKKALFNAQKALSQLETFLLRQPHDDLVRAAVIQAFEFTFEAFWKLLQKMAADEGVTAHSPKSALSFGYHQGLCADEAVWLAMLRDRNLTVHTYNELLAAKIFAAVANTYISSFRVALDVVEKKIR